MEVRVGSPKFLVEERIAVPVSFAEVIQAHSREGKTVIVVLSGRSRSGALILTSSIKQEPARVLPPQTKKPAFGSVFTRSLLIACIVVVAVLVSLAWYQI